MKTPEYSNNYPWSVQPRVIDGETLWVTFNAETDYESHGYLTYSAAARHMYHLLKQEAADARRRDVRSRVAARVKAAEKAKYYYNPTTADKETSKARPEYPTESPDDNYVCPEEYAWFCFHK